MSLLYSSLKWAELSGSGGFKGFHVARGFEMLIVGAVPSKPQTLAKPEFAATSTMAQIQQRGSMKVAVCRDIPGFCFAKNDDSPVRGFEIDLAYSIAHYVFGGSLKDAEKYVEFVPMTLGERDELIKEAQVDIAMGNYADTPERRQFMDFAGHYIFSPQSPLAAIDSPRIVDGSDMNGLQIGTVAGSIEAETTSIIAPSAEVLEFATVQDTLDALRNGKVQAYMASLAFNVAVAKYLGDPFVPTPVRHGGERLGLGLRKGDEEFRDFIDDVVSSAFSSGELNDSLRRWLG